MQRLIAARTTSDFDRAWERGDGPFPGRLDPRRDARRRRRLRRRGRHDSGSGVRRRAGPNHLAKTDIEVKMNRVLVGVAQLVRAPDCGSGRRGFESRHSPCRTMTYGEPIRASTVVAEVGGREKPPDRLQPVQGAKRTFRPGYTLEGQSCRSSQSLSFAVPHVIAGTSRSASGRSSCTRRSGRLSDSTTS